MLCILEWSEIIQDEFGSTHEKIGWNLYLYFLIDQPVSINKIIYTGVLAFCDFELRVPGLERKKVTAWSIQGV